MKGKLTVLVLIILLALLAGCGVDRHVKVSAGEYIPIRDAGTPDYASAIETVRIDRENQIAWFVLTDGSQLIVSFTPRARAAWPAGCPTNVSSTRMEVLNLEVETLTIASMSFENSVLVRNCPPEPEEVVLRSDGEIGGGGTACSGATECVVLEVTSGTTSLPRSMKGYELYSWYTEKDSVWIYTLVTGTNRQKSYAELSTSESVIAEDDWVKITVSGTSALKSVLNLLPEGEIVLWLDAGRLEGAPAIEAVFPSRRVVQEIEQYCERKDIGLEVFD
jgi:hypothetical protein